VTTIKAGSGGTPKAVKFAVVLGAGVAIIAANSKAAPLVVAFLAAAIAFQILTIQVVK
jgi:hypothetical protein